MSQISTHRARRLNWKVKRGQGRAVYVICRVAGELFDISDRDYTVNVRRFGSNVNLFTLTEGNGITNSGVDGQLTLLPSDEQVNLPPARYYWELLTDDPDIWLNGEFIVVDSLSDSCNDDSLETTIQVDENMVTINITISGSGGGTERYRGEVSISGNLFPETGGANDMRSGRPQRGDWFLFTTSGTLLDRNENAMEIPANSIGFYIGDDNGDMQLGANWKVNQG